MAYPYIKSDAEIEYFLKQIGMKKRRALLGLEREQMLIVFKLIEPTQYVNDFSDQKTFIQIYHYANKEYEVTWGYNIQGEEEPYVEELTDYDL
jgi:hypothetical protein